MPLLGPLFPRTGGAVLAKPGRNQPGIVQRVRTVRGFVPQRRNMLYEPVDTPETDKFGRPKGKKKAVVSEVEAEA